MFKVGDMVLLKVKYFLHKNKKFATAYDGPFIFTRVSENNTVTIRPLHGTMENNYNTEMFRIYHKKKEKKKENRTASLQSSNIEEQVAKEKAKRQRKIHPGREDGGPSTRSKMAQENQLL